MTAAIAPSTAVLEEIRRRVDAIAAQMPAIGRTLCAMQNGELSISSKNSPRDLVTAADIASQNALVDFIHERFPGDAILAEEGNAGHWRETVARADYCWVIDPLDGTVNYSHGIPLFCISVGLTFQGEPVGGLVLAPALGDFFRAIVGQGAYLNEKQVRVSNVERLSGAMIVTGFPYEREKYITTLLQGVEVILMRGQGLRRTGSAAMDLCWLAMGRFDAFYELTLNPWDTCAGLVMLREAGGAVTGLRGEPFEMYHPIIVATNGRIQAELVAALAQIQPPV